MRRLLVLAFVPLAAGSALHSGTPLVIGHRGASGTAPEHTIAAYDRALAFGADYIEQDLQMTRDSVLVVMHDPTLDRTMRGAPADCKGRVIDKTLAQIKQCDAGLWFNERYPQLAKPEFLGQRVLTLEELFQRYGDSTNYYIETKNPEDAPGMERRMIALIRQYTLGPKIAPRGRVVIQSFSEPSLRLVHELAPKLPLVQLIEKRPVGDLDAAFARIGSYAEGVGPDKRLIDAEWMKAAHAHCLAVHPYTVNETEEMRRLLALGVDGMFTNFADRMRALVPGPRIRMARYCASSSWRPRDE